MSPMRQAAAKIKASANRQRMELEAMVQVTTGARGTLVVVPVRMNTRSKAGMLTSSSASKSSKR